MKHLLSVCDMENEVESFLKLGLAYKNHGSQITPLKDKTLGMIFQKSSTRTRISFEVGMNQLGGRALYLSTADLQIGRGEPISDTARVMSRYLDGIMIRAVNHFDVVELSEYSSIPVINGLTNLEHPCQALADMLSIYEFKKSFKDKTLVFIGDGNNVCNSLILISGILGLNMNIACPSGYEPDTNIYKKGKEYAEKSNSELNIIHDIEEAVSNTDVVYTDVWVSMGDENEENVRNDDFSNFQVNNEVMKLAKDDAIFMHCLPAIRGQEVASEVIDGPQSIIWDQAENRLHVQKAVMYYLMK